MVLACLSKNTYILGQISLLNARPTGQSGRCFVSTRRMLWHLQVLIRCQTAILSPVGPRKILKIYGMRCGDWRGWKTIDQATYITIKIECPGCPDIKGTPHLGGSTLTRPSFLTAAVCVSVSFCFLTLWLPFPLLWVTQNLAKLTSPWKQGVG